MNITINVQSDAVQRALKRLSLRLSNLSPIFRGIGADVVADAQLRFKDSRDPYGVAWKPLSFAARMARARRVSGGKSPLKRNGTFKKAAFGAFTTAKPLLDTGRLRNSVTFRLAGPAAVEVGTTVVYGPIHQFGGQAGRGKKVTIPRRSFIATKDRGLPREYGEIIRDQLVLHLRGTGVTGRP